MNGLAVLAFLAVGFAFLNEKNKNAGTGSSTGVIGDPVHLPPIVVVTNTTPTNGAGFVDLTGDAGKPVLGGGTSTGLEASPSTWAVGNTSTAGASIQGASGNAGASGTGTAGN